MDADTVQLVDSKGNTIGQATKESVHLPPGTLHRAVSVVLLSPEKRVLLQRRAAKKYHFGGIWANSCCTHPYGDESAIVAAHRAVKSELGLDCDLQPIGEFTYRAVDSVSGLVEHEFDHVFVGTTDGEIRPNPEEVEATSWVTLPEIEAMMSNANHDLAPWFAQVIALARRSQLFV